MKLYLAAPFCTKARIAKIAAEARRAGFMVASTWHDEKVEVSGTTTGPATSLSDAAALDAMSSDLLQVKKCDVLVLFSWGGLDSVDFGSFDEVKRHSTGRHFEAGYAHALGKKLIHVGTPESIFTRSIARQCQDWHDALLELVAMRQSSAEAAS